MPREIITVTDAYSSSTLILSGSCHASKIKTALWSKQGVRVTYSEQNLFSSPTEFDDKITPDFSRGKKMYFLASIQAWLTHHADFRVATAIAGGTKVQPSILAGSSGKQLSNTQVDRSLPGKQRVCQAFRYTVSTLSERQITFLHLSG